MGFGIVAALLGPPKKQTIDIGDEPEAFSEAEYMELAKKAGFHRAIVAIDKEKVRTVTRKLRRFLAANGITVYNDNRVNTYMNSITPTNHRWRWNEVNGSGNYSEPIPQAVLMTMAKIREAFPSVLFEITEIYDVPKGDPFLRCGIGEEKFIIERWNEPGFRM